MKNGSFLRVRHHSNMDNTEFGSYKLKSRSGTLHSWDKKSQVTWFCNTNTSHGAEDVFFVTALLFSDTA